MLLLVPRCSTPAHLVSACGPWQADRRWPLALVGTAWTNAQATDRPTGVRSGGGRRSHRLSLWPVRHPARRRQRPAPRRRWCFASVGLAGSPSGRVRASSGVFRPCHRGVGCPKPSGEPSPPASREVSVEDSLSNAGAELLAEVSGNCGRRVDGLTRVPQAAKDKQSTSTDQTARISRPDQFL